MEHKPDWDSIADRIILFEDGHLDDRETVQLFQDLVTSGDAWTLPGYYGRHAEALIDAGKIKRGTHH